MKYTKEEILNALQIIQNECRVHEYSCYDCPFYNQDDGCAINKGIPNFWKINECEVVWRALR